MSAENLLLQSVNITAIGMLVVLAFLVILIGVVKLLGELAQWAEKRWPAQDGVLLAVAIAAAKRFQTK